MADSTAYAETPDEAAGGSARGSAPRTPRWVKVSGVLALIAVGALIFMLVAGGGQHGPGRHGGSSGRDPASQQEPASRQQQPASQAPGGIEEGQAPSGGGAGGHTPPPGGH